MIIALLSWQNKAVLATYIYVTVKIFLLYVLLIRQSVWVVQKVSHVNTQQ